MNEAHPLDLDEVLRSLKPFQRQSVDYIFGRFYGPDHTRRFLLADEVGLGKTLVARGVIARTIAHLWNTVPQIDVVYICSNQDIARQNIKRLNPTLEEIQSPLERITLLPRLCRNAPKTRASRLNLIAITPGTSLDPKSGGGRWEERVLLYHLLKAEWRLDGAAPTNVLCLGVSPDKFRDRLAWFDDSYDINERLASEFLVGVRSKPDLAVRFDRLCREFPRANSRVTEEARNERHQLIGELRGLLAKTCIRFLQPDLIVLDEFQRFKELLSTGTDSGELAHDLFEYCDEHSEARVLLLSATPYKMYTVSQESAEDDHYKDFLATLDFLFRRDQQKTARVESLLREYRRQLYRLGEGDRTDLDKVRQDVEQVLRSVMCRTERLAVTADRSGMLKEVGTSPRLDPSDIGAYLHTQQMARALGHYDTMEYWKSAPYLLNFMENYQLKRAFKEACEEDQPTKELRDLVAVANVSLLPWGQVERYEPIAPHNARIRALMTPLMDNGAWRCLWIPASLPYYSPGQPFAGLGATGLTKRLVFSNWQVVPKAVATLVSYEVERRMITLHNPKAKNTDKAREKRRSLLNFARSPERLTGMPLLVLLYPSTYLAEHFDPLRLMAEQEKVGALTLDDVISLTEYDLEGALAPILAKARRDGPEDESWYWLAPLLLDYSTRPELTRSWWDEEGLAAAWSGQDDTEHFEAAEKTMWDEHVAEAAASMESTTPRGRPPADLARVIAQMAVAGPGVVALRALARVTGGQAHLLDDRWRHAAGRVAWGFRRLFNAPEVTAMIRGMNGAEPYWRRVLEYCVAGNLQSVLDEYAHVLRELVVGYNSDAEKACGNIAAAVSAAVSLRVALPGVDRIELDADGERISINNERIRARFAMRFGEERSDKGDNFRADDVRRSFNSPFWPFVLATTSVGQEGLDFHPYCHAVVHWNLPSNPVDLEQREGRVHRYKGHAVRRNVARTHAHQLTSAMPGDPWESLFELATIEAADPQGLKPYWVYPRDGGAVIERHVLALPLSREADHLPHLRSSLAVYRMVFGQPRQDDLLEYLMAQMPREMIAQQMDELRINLTPHLPRHD